MHGVHSQTGVHAIATEDENESATENQIGKANAIVSAQLLSEKKARW
jgi:hypothetical protein